jgi:UDP-glucose-4-epimerase GalE
MPIDETMPQHPINPYGESKLVMERMCRAFEISYGIKSIALRYFNACGADIDGEIGERHDPEPHLIPRVLMAADGALDAIDIFGSDYPTPDGSCVRDYIHVADLADAHVTAARHLINGGGSDVINLGTGRGHSVFEVVASVERVAKKPVPLRIGPRRPGDPAELIADVTKASRVLGWRAGNSGLDQIIQSAWAWYRKEASRAAKV